MPRLEVFLSWKTMRLAVDPELVVDFRADHLPVRLQELDRLGQIVPCRNDGLEGGKDHEHGDYHATHADSQHDGRIAALSGANLRQG